MESGDKMAKQWEGLECTSDCATKVIFQYLATQPAPGRVITLQSSPCVSLLVSAVWIKRIKKMWGKKKWNFYDSSNRFVKLSVLYTVQSTSCLVVTELAGWVQTKNSLLSVCLRLSIARHCGARVVPDRSQWVRCLDHQIVLKCANRSRSPIVLP